MNELATIETDGQTSILGILGAAIEKGMSVEAIEKLTGLYERLDNKRAEREYAKAKAAFQSECPIIAKTSRASFATKAGGNASYAYAELDEIAKTIRECCGKHGLSYSWDNEVTDAMMRVTCKVRHTGGFVDSAAFVSPIDGSSLMSSSQKGAATLTQAKRQALVQALGLIVGDHDTDDMGGYSKPSGPKITEHQAANIEAFIDELGADRQAFLAYIGVERIADIPVSEFQRAIKALEAKREKNKAGSK